MEGSRVSPMSEWLNSDVFMISVVVLLLTVIGIFAVCCIIWHRRPHKRAGKMAEVEIIPSTNSDRNDQPSFILRIFTEQKHASDIVQMLTGQTDSTLGPVCPTDQGVSTVNIEDADAPQDQPRTFTSPQLQTSNLETGNVVHNEGSDASENEPQQYYPALS